MRKFILVIAAMLLWQIKYQVSVNLVPALSLIKNLREAHPWISGSLFVQLTMLLFAVIFIFIFLKGNFSGCGFRSTGFTRILKAFFTAFWISLVLMVINIIITMISGPPQGGKGSVLSGNLWLDIFYIWVIASSIEEIFYRGFIQTFLNPLKNIKLRLGKIKLSLPVIIAAVLFALTHFCLWEIMPHRMVYFIIFNTFILGIIAGYWREKTGSLLPAYAVHLCFNIVGMMLPRLLMALMG